MLRVWSKPCHRRPDTPEFENLEFQNEREDPPSISGFRIVCNV
jgi:hypothetical protein